ncbi:chromosome partitioning protein ParA [Yersinia pseudotuberculosis]|uniref:Plasmid partition protein n=1 Tax=Yersinia pseudotuberculosis TaxID=633 RepID=A0A380SD93_YERPU|nr:MULTISPECIES: ParA family protein [Yersinia pseudotuberculosis complex]AIN13753.1 cobQ/CobB/MinD/ParA nucleotide binding domain protein [Yersinia pseudotuberculosis]MBO1552104.1 AAA family ATPase [Yersinia pseudotuberculosis]MBO1572310.1 AAA family ATPase [Yersinia pseudotuberculosis]MBO1587200.1 AAA family ATPase [Yersinia pseudotuberculosis]MBO1636734.1 AAA family ATPase [Yersinia pseudotuberculosis]
MENGRTSEALGLVIVVGNQKGGVVKSQSTNELSYDLQQSGFKTLAIDMDWTAGLTERSFPDGMPIEIEREPFKHEFSPGEAHSYQLFFPNTIVKPIPLADGRHFIGTTYELNEINYRPQDCIFDFKDRIDELRKEYDYIVIDSNPSYSNVMIASHLVADYLIIPTLLEKSSRNGVAKQLGYMQKIKKNLNPKLEFLGVYVTQAVVSNYKKDLLDGRLTAVDTENLRLLFEILQLNGYSTEKVLAYISYVSTTAKEAIELGLTFKEYAPKSLPALQYEELTQKLISLTQGA